MLLLRYEIAAAAGTQRTFTLLQLSLDRIFVLFRGFHAVFSLFRCLLPQLLQPQSWFFTNYDPGPRLTCDGPIMYQLPALYEIHGTDDVDVHAARLIEKKTRIFGRRRRYTLWSLVESRLIEPVATHTKYLHFPDLLL